MRSVTGKSLLVLSCLGLLTLMQGCGYTTRSLLPSNFKTIYVESFKNTIKITAEQSDVRMYTGYVPGMEIGLTKAVIDKYISDGNLRIASESDADLVMKGTLTDFRKEPLRYDANDNVDEYRIKLIVDLELVDQESAKTVWTEKGFAGETTYRTSGTLTTSENVAMKDAMYDLARRIVERTVEAW